MTENELDDYIEDRIDAYVAHQNGNSMIISINQIKMAVLDEVISKASRFYDGETWIPLSEVHKLKGE